MKSISEAYISKLQEENIANGLDIVKIRYALAVLKDELIKTILLICIFALLGQLKPFLMVMLLILPIRLSTGGIHFQRNIPCFLFSLGYFLVAVCLLPLLKVELTFLYSVLGLSILTIAVCPLAPSEKRPIISRKKYLQNKYFSLIYLVIFTFILLSSIENQAIIGMCIWALALHATELLFIRVHKRKGGLTCFKN
ncbi:accessory gene regulator ArgB-like protein [Clostridium aminobutyricum]|uniref:Accessory gene regulator B family protein n=1 Tax=Clostridium aminobutyricum TaxID=33953 RepID=A0A939D671_CLOAM|nr:accessory gene regulator B family protein [Clostridium aminobutyricum]MBN7771947.1 accessory gene regulator B family protein [Clostridium aminobutyricum]